MNLKELKDRIKHLIDNPEEDIGQIVIDSELKGIKQTVEAVDKTIVFDDLDGNNCTHAKDWLEIKQSLSTFDKSKGT